MTANMLNKQASSTTGIYQQSVLLRARLSRLHHFSDFVVFSQSSSRASLDIVHQLWETFALGKPLCVLLNLLPIPDDAKVPVAVDFADLEETPKNERKKAVAKFIMAIENLRKSSFWDEDIPTLSISEIVDQKETSAFVKLVTCLLHLLDKLPQDAWADEAAVQTRGLVRVTSMEALFTPKTPKEVERSNRIRELIETERKYCQDLEVMQVRVFTEISACLILIRLGQSYANALSDQSIVDRDTIHNLFPALTNLANSQRKLLITLENTLENAWENQNWGRCFIDHVSSSIRNPNMSPNVIRL